VITTGGIGCRDGSGNQEPGTRNWELGIRNWAFKGDKQFAALLRL
jgi:hypothetical protein